MLQSGTTLGPYEIVAALGAGGMGEVYKARDPQFHERFDREARAISQLTHPHICTLFDVGEAPDPQPSALPRSASSSWNCSRASPSRRAWRKAHSRSIRP